MYITPEILITFGVMAGKMLSAAIDDAKLT
jgi:hypothetical protein